MKRFSILHLGKFYPPHVGGMETFLRGLVRWESPRWDVTAMVAHIHPYTETEELDGGTITRLATFGSIASMPITPGMPFYLHGRKDDIVHLHTPNPMAAACFLLSGHPGRLVITHHGDTTGRKWLRRFSDPFVRKAMQRADAIITSSQPYLDSSPELRPFRDKCHVVPFGRDIPPASALTLENARKLRARYGNRLVVGVGRLVPFKGFDYLIRALRSADATLLLLGNGAMRQKLEMVAQTAGVADRVHFVGHVDVDRVQDYLHASDIFVLPSISRAESFGLVQLEAMAAGLPIINTQLPSGVPEVAPHGETGITVPPANEDALAHAIRTLLDDDALRAKYGAASQKRVKEFSANAMCARIEEIYREVLHLEGAADPR